MNAEAKSKSGERRTTVRTESLPLFPLKVFLFPGIPLRLQVFEQRYLDMIKRQLRESRGFGIVPISRGEEVGNVPEVYPYGVEVLLTDWDQKPNGLLQLELIGERRFAVEATSITEDRLMMGEVRFLEQDIAEPVSEEYQGLADLLEQLKQHQEVVAMQLPPAANTSDLSNQLSFLLPLLADEKIAAFKSLGPVERLEFLARKVWQLAKE